MHLTCMLHVCLHGYEHIARIRIDVSVCNIQGEPDAILSINAAFANDPHPHKVNLGVGAYRDEVLWAQ